VVNDISGQVMGPMLEGQAVPYRWDP